MELVTILRKTKQAIEKPIDIAKNNDDSHSRYEIAHKNYRTILIKNIPFLITCREDEKLVVLENQSISIEKGLITQVAPFIEIKRTKFDLIYDAGKRGGTVVTPGFINTHAHIHMYLLRSAMALEEEESVDQTIAGMADWLQNENEESYTFASIGDLTEQQKYGITTTLTHGPSFLSAEISARLTRHHLINAVSAVSNSRKENTPEMVEEILKKKKNFFSVPAVAVHYLYKTPRQTLKKIKNLIEKYDTLFTFHMAESPFVAEETLKRHRMSETEVLEKYGLLGPKSLASHVLYVKPEEIKKLSENKLGIVHLPTSNVLHKSGLFPYWKFQENGGYPQVSLGTDSVVSKNRLDLLTEAYQARITHLYSRTIKYGSLFKMMTINGARVLNLPDRGKIVPGMRADLAFWKLRDRGFIPFDKNHPATLIGNLITHEGRMVRDLMINGQFVIKDRRHLFINETKLLDILQEKHMQMRQRLKAD